MISFKSMLKSKGYKKESITGMSNYKANPIIEKMSELKGRTIEEVDTDVWSNKKLGKVKGMGYSLQKKRPLDMDRFHNDLCHFKAGRITQNFFNSRYGFDPTNTTRFGISLIIKRYKEMGFDFRSPNMIYQQDKRKKSIGR